MTTSFWSSKSRGLSEKYTSCNKNNCKEPKPFLTNTWYSSYHSEFKKTKTEQDVYTPKQPIENELKTKRIRLYPTSEQEKTLIEWFDGARATHNMVLRAVKDNIEPLKDLKLGSNEYIKKLRELFLNGKDFKTNNKWIKNTPSAIRDDALHEVLRSYKSNFALKRKHFDILFKSKKASSQSISIPKKDYKPYKAFFPRKLGKIPIKSSYPLPDKLEHDIKIVKTRLNHYYMFIPVPIETFKSENQGKVVSIDPGIRTFTTCYDAEKGVIEIGKNANTKLFRLCYGLDKIRSKIDHTDTRSKKRDKYRKAYLRGSLKIRNLVDQLHIQVVDWLCKNYNTILLPKFETSKMVVKGQRKLGSKSVRAMYTFSHYRFRQRLLHKTREYPDCNVIICDEAYTSKTCGNCGEIKWNLGSSKVYNCKSCGYIADRDFNGARNILLRYLSKEESVTVQTLC